MKEFDYEKQPTVTIVKEILQDALSRKVTDIHLDPIDDGMIIKFRIDGELEDYTKVPENNKTNIITRFKIISGMNITNTFMPQTGFIKINHEDITYNTYVSTLPVIYGEKIVIHISNYAEDIKNIDEIGFSKEDIEKVKKALQEKQGLILINGTTTSGKSTTMYSILKELNNKKRNIISIENPVKMKIPGINQVQIQEDKGINYNTLLRNITLNDPNIIAIDELIDDEITRKAIRLAASGNLIISKMPYKTIYQTVDALLKMDVENYLLGANLNEIICQRLVKKLCPTCKQKQKATEYEKKIIKEITGNDVNEIYYPIGCEECNNGYKDQIPVEEVINLNEELRNAISNNKTRDLIKKIIYSETTPLIKDGFNKVINGDTSFAEIIRILDTKIDLNEEQEELKQFIFANGNLDDTTDANTIEATNEETTSIKDIELEQPMEIPDNTNSPTQTIIEASATTVKTQDNSDTTETTYQAEDSAKEETQKPKESEQEEPKEETPTEETTTEEETPKKEAPKEKASEETTVKVPEEKVTPFKEKVTPFKEKEETKKEESAEETKENETSIKEISKKKSFIFDDDDDDDDDDDYNYDSSYTIV